MLRVCHSQGYEGLPDDTRVKLLDDAWQPLFADQKAIRQLQRSLVVQLSPLVPHLKR